MSFKSIIHHCFNEPADYTYIGIGSAPHLPIEQLDAQTDQLIPVFILNVLGTTNYTVRCIHIDPAFNLNTLQAYFNKQTLGLVYTSFTHIDSYEYHMWSNDRIEMIFMFESFDHEWFLDDFCQMTIDTKKMLVYQDYTGHNSIPLFKRLYQNSTNRRVFKKKILFDITYGNDYGCMTNLSKYWPLYDSYGDFINLHLLSHPSDIKEICGQSQRTDALLVEFFKKEFITLLKNYHSDYRRSIQGSTCLFQQELTDPDDIMKALRLQINNLLHLFNNLSPLSDTQKDEINELFNNYRERDPYKWYYEMNSIIVG